MLISTISSYGIFGGYVKNIKCSDRSSEVSLQRHAAWLLALTRPLPVLGHESEQQQSPTPSKLSPAPDESAAPPFRTPFLRSDALAGPTS